MPDYRRSAYERLLGAGVDEETAMTRVGHESRRTLSRYNVRTLRRVQAALDQTGASLHYNSSRRGCKSYSGPGRPRGGVIR